ncbi:AmmeMemoRadiSam system protein B [Oceanotoga sp. DSM 15011]|uniref:AmmeMemoRadiSam system protein B n=1 Tax=Oceanotoga TaxID=1255275 RepID=UPI0021F4261A|nr:MULTISPECIES: AmmeMemoRadiSam system protein B [Oceanotoga]MDO7976019.1 AmmeMemoRadiSam system protein B [Oceanotoga teriensis]UYO98986.1 AmmeMemoRadiSam system protein B [Oceanotoga sp. DSM 15011]
MIIRKPAVAGLFYPDNDEQLKQKLNFIFERDTFKMENKLNSKVGVILPHAGYVYSGKTTAKALKKASKFGCPNRIFLFGPDHKGLGSGINIDDSDFWALPGLKFEVDKDTVLDMCRMLNINPDRNGHFAEHSLEVQLPFLNYVFGNNFKIVPITFTHVDQFELKLFLEAFKGIFNEGDFIVASTDLNHFEDQKTTIEKDKKIIEAIEKNDPELLLETIRKNDISMCGYLPTYILLSMGLKNIEITHHTTSGEILNDFESVVGYLSAVLYD